MPSTPALKQRRSKKQKKLQRKRPGSPARLRIRRAIKRIERKLKKRRLERQHRNDVTPRPPAPMAKNPVHMFDSIDVDQIPRDAEAVAGYTSGSWPTFPQLVHEFPDAHRLSIAVSSSHDAECLDIEDGDAEPADAPRWVRRQHQRGLKQPVVYASVSVMQDVLDILAAAGIKRDQVRVWAAHYTGHAHICDERCGYRLRRAADATQFTSHSHGRNLDESLCTADFFN